MIRYIKRRDLDVKKYDACIERALNSRIYAYSWYLDIVADNWDVLILNDYEAVMPLPWRSKYFIKYIYPPCWTQQLGIFAQFKITSDWTLKFVKSIPKKFKKVTIAFNSENECTGLKVEKKNNYILDLNRPYEEVFKSYKYVRRRNKIQFQNKGFYTVSSVSIDSVISMFKANKKNVHGVTDKDYLKLKNISNFLTKNNKCDILLAFDGSDDIIGGALFIFDLNRVYYLFSGLTDKGRKENVMSHLIDLTIHENSSSSKIFDFEGSMLHGVAFFFRSFGSKKEEYFIYSEYHFL